MKNLKPARNRSIPMSISSRKKTLDLARTIGSNMIVHSRSGMSNSHAPKVVIPSEVRRDEKKFEVHHVVHDDLTTTPRT